MNKEEHKQNIISLLFCDALSGYECKGDYVFALLRNGFWEFQFTFKIVVEL